MTKSKPKLPPGAAMDIASAVYNEDPQSGRQPHERGRKALDDLRKLRLSLARVAEALGVKDPVLLNDPMRASQHTERGWNSLAADCVGKAQELQRDIKVFRAGLVAHVNRLAEDGPLLEQATEDIERINAATGHGAEGSIVGEHLLANGRRYRITESGLPYTPGEYPSGGLRICAWHPAIENWSYVSNAPSEVEARAFLASAERLSDEGTQWRQSDAPEA